MELTWKFLVLELLSLESERRSDSVLLRTQRRAAFDSETPVSV
jgi:hypothetical protein